MSRYALKLIAEAYRNFFNQINVLLEDITGLLDLLIQIHLISFYRICIFKCVIQKNIKIYGIKYKHNSISIIQMTIMGKQHITIANKTQLMLYEPLSVILFSRWLPNHVMSVLNALLASLIKFYISRKLIYEIFIDAFFKATPNKTIHWHHI